jgi:hypothetical protein
VVEMGTFRGFMTCFLTGLIELSIVLDWHLRHFGWIGVGVRIGLHIMDGYEWDITVTAFLLLHRTVNYDGWDGYLGWITETWMKT